MMGFACLNGFLPFFRLLLYHIPAKEESPELPSVGENMGISVLQWVLQCNGGRMLSVKIQQAFLP